MMELPESYTLAKQMNEYLIGKCVSEIEILHTPHKFAFFKGNLEDYPELLEGKSITGAKQVGGMLQMDLEESMLVFADGVTPKYYEEKRNFPENHQLALYFDDDTALFCSIRMYGFIIASPAGACEDEFYLSSAGKPNPLSEGFTYDYFRGLFPENRKMSAKAFLATEQRIPGLGNGVLQDILWDAGIDPRFSMNQATEEDFEKLYQSTVRMLRKMSEEGGRDVEVDLFGKAGGYISQLSKKSLNEPCMRCGTMIQKASYMGGTIYYCEKCQRR